jgi:hypothetical protein
MNLTYPVPERFDRPVLWLLVAALLTASLFLVLRSNAQPLSVKVAQPVSFSASQEIRRAVPVPEPPHSQPAPTPHANTTPVPPGAQLRPVPQPVPTPPPDR